MQVRTFVDVLRRRWISIVAIVVVCTGVAAEIAYSATPLYKTSAKVYFSLVNGTTANDLSQGSTYTQNLVLTYAQMATTPIVLTPVINELKLGMSPGQLAGKVSATATTNTVILTITVTDSSPQRAASIANDVADQLGTTVRELSPKDAKGQSTVLTQTVGPALVPKSASSPKKGRNIAAAFVGGLLLAIAYAMLRELLATTVERRRSLKSVTDAPILGEVPSSDELANQRLGDGSVASPIFGQLSSSIDFLSVDRRPLSLVITSASPKEGKTLIALNLALASADSGSRTLLIDADLRDPIDQSRIRRTSGPGLSTVLVGRASFDEVVVALDRNLDVLASGPRPPNPSYLLGSQSMARLLQDVGGRYDVILIDAPALLSNDDAASLVDLTAGIVLVARVARRLRLFGRRHARLDEARIAEALDSIGDRGAVLGIIVNGTARKAGRRRNADALPAANLTSIS
jgi:succinoglycan biosynthesis transport protein ExoP